MMSLGKIGDEYLVEYEGRLTFWGSKSTVIVWLRTSLFLFRLVVNALGFPLPG